MDNPCRYPYRVNYPLLFLESISCWHNYLYLRNAALIIQFSTKPIFIRSSTLYLDIDTSASLSLQENLAKCVTPVRIIFTTQNHIHARKSSHITSSKLDRDIRASHRRNPIYFIALLGFLKKKCVRTLLFGKSGFMDHGLRATANPIFALFSMALVSTSPEMVMSDLGRHSCCIRALVLP